MSQTNDDHLIINGPPPLLPLPKISLGEFIHHQLTTAPQDSTAIVEGYHDKSITFKQILYQTETLSHVFKLMGLKKGSIISICSENNLEFIIPVISALYLGVIVAPVNHLYTTYELKHSFNITKPELVFCSMATYQKVLGLKLGFIKKIVILDGSIEGLDNFYALLNGCDNRHFCLEENIDADNDEALIMCSSGTTGLPKGVMITHKNIMVRLYQNIDPLIFGQEFEIVHCILPLFHAYGLISMISFICKGLKFITMKQFDELKFLESIEKHRATSLWLAPPLVLFLAKSPLVFKFNLTSVKMIRCGASSLDKDTENTVKKRLNNVSVLQAYGLTESTLGVLFILINDEKDGSVGKVTRYMSIKIRDQNTGKSLGPNQVGEICIKGPMVMKGYKNNPEATKATITPDGWLLSGDLGYYDENKYFYIVGRLKELIKYKGFQVPPAEIEAVLLTHSDIIDAGVVGKPDEIAGELPTAFVVKKTGSKLNEKLVQNYVATQLSSQKHLRGGVIFIGHIPKNPSGKILRNKLKEMLNEYTGGKSKL